MVQRILCFAILAIVADSACAAERRGVVEGDRALLDALVAAQLTGSAAFPRGALDAEVSASRGPEVVHTSAHLIWSDSSTYWNYRETVKSQGTDPSISKGEMIETRDLLICYWPEFKLVQIIRDRKYGYRRELRLRPDQVWFGSLDGSRSWSDLFDPGTPERPPAVVFDNLAVSGDKDDVAVIRELEGSTFRIRASLVCGGNVVEYDSRPVPDAPVGFRGSYEWTELPDRRWRLKHYEYQFSATGNMKNPEQRYDLMVTSFEPEPAIPANRFTFDSLNIPDGTLIEEVSAAGTKSYRKGRKSPTAQEVLDDLARDVRSKGFAASPTEDYK